MRYPASEKLEIIRIVEQSHLPTKITLDKLGVARRTFYRWYDRYLEGGPEALADKPSSPSRVLSRVSEAIHDQIIDMALEQSELSPRELAVRIADEHRYFVPEATVYRLLKAHDLIISPAFVVMKAANEFHTKTVRPSEMWQTDFTYFKIIGWGWMYLSTVLDDCSRYIIRWKLCMTMRAHDVTDTLELALQASGCDHATVQHKPRLLSDNGPSYIACKLAEYIEAQKMSHARGGPMHPQTQGKIERWHQTLKNRILLENYFLRGDLERQIEAFVEHYNHQRYHESQTTSRQPMPASAGRKPSSNNATGLNDRPSNIGACNTASSLLNINPIDEAGAPLIYAAISAKCSDDGHENVASDVFYKVVTSKICCGASLDQPRQKAVSGNFVRLRTLVKKNNSNIHKLKTFLVDSRFVGIALSFPDH